MKKLILIPIATLTALTPMVSMIGCNKSQEKALASISYTYIKVDPKPYVYQSTQ
ncbi:MAG: hypothetical protein MJ201_01300 [Mycoplasmoidaceae bacterium]|nr:hypothetical protein [Mycoplasmoidaceae bacterium]